MESFGCSWHCELMAYHRMTEMRREVEEIQLLMEAGLYNPGLFERMVKAIEHRLIRFGVPIRKNHNERQQAYHVTTYKYAA